MLQIGYSSDLYNCSSCLGFSSGTGYSGRYRITSQTWGCDTCATVVAPVSYYETQGSQVASPEQLKQYLNDLTYKNNVDVKWSSLSRCQKGTTVKNICINKDIPIFSINVPQQNEGPANPQPSSGLSSGILATIIIFSIIGFVLLLFIAYAFVFWKKYGRISL
jgi:ribosomal protein L37AE/L43A